jgi:hypothetical protein
MVEWPETQPAVAWLGGVIPDDPMGSDHDPWCLCNYHCRVCFANLLPPYPIARFPRNLYRFCDKECEGRFTREDVRRQRARRRELSANPGPGGDQT